MGKVFSGMQGIYIWKFLCFQCFQVLFGKGVVIDDDVGEKVFFFVVMVGYGVIYLFVVVCIVGEIDVIFQMIQ